LLPPPADSASLLTLPPNVNAGAGAEIRSPAALLLVATPSTGLSGSETVEAGLFSGEALGLDSRAGAGALAALVAGAEAAEKTLGAEVCAAGFAIDGETTSSLSKRSASLSLISAGTEATTVGCAAGF